MSSNIEYHKHVRKLKP